MNLRQLIDQFRFDTRDQEAKYLWTDDEIIGYINTALSTMTQVGVGPEQGFAISDEFAEWDALLGGDHRLNAVINYVSMSVRLMFDPPATSFGINAIQDQLNQMIWRIEVAANPAPTPVIPVVVSNDPFSD